MDGACGGGSSDLEAPVEASLELGECAELLERPRASDVDRQRLMVEGPSATFQMLSIEGPDRVRGGAAR